VNDVVLDASALLAVLRAEPGAERVVPRLEGARIGAVNLSEVVTKLIEDDVPEARSAAPSGASSWTCMHSMRGSPTLPAFYGARPAFWGCRSVIGPVSPLPRAWVCPRSPPTAPGRASTSALRSR
jgi:hypothetical protein